MSTDALEAKLYAEGYQDGAQTGVMAALDDRQKINQLRALVLEMGRAIRRLDSNNEHLEFWTQDGDYLLDGRWK